MFSQRLLKHECVTLRSAAHNMSTQGNLHQTTYIGNSEKGARDPSLTFCKNLDHLVLMRGPIEPKTKDAPTRPKILERIESFTLCNQSAPKQDVNKCQTIFFYLAPLLQGHVLKLTFFQSSPVPSRLAMADDVAELCAPPAAAKIATHLCLHAHTAS